jgi:hypothetical protein
MKPNRQSSSLHSIFHQATSSRKNHDTKVLWGVGDKIFDEIGQLARTTKKEDTDTDTDTGNVQSRTYAMGEAAIHDRARTTPDH